MVLFGSVAEGVLVGALFSKSYTQIYGPPAFLLPLVMGLAAHYAGSKEQVAGNHRAFLISHLFLISFFFTFYIFRVLWWEEVWPPAWCSGSCSISTLPTSCRC